MNRTHILLAISFVLAVIITSLSFLLHKTTNNSVPPTQQIAAQLTVAEIENAKLQNYGVAFNKDAPLPSTFACGQEDLLPQSATSSIVILCRTSPATITDTNKNYTRLSLILAKEMASTRPMQTIAGELAGNLGLGAAAIKGGTYKCAEDISVSSPIQGTERDCTLTLKDKTAYFFTIFFFKTSLTPNATLFLYTYNPAIQAQAGYATTTKSTFDSVIQGLSVQKNVSWLNYFAQTAYADDASGGPGDATGALGGGCADTGNCVTTSFCSYTGTVGWYACSGYVSVTLMEGHSVTIDNTTPGYTGAVDASCVGNGTLNGDWSISQTCTANPVPVNGVCDFSAVNACAAGVLGSNAYQPSNGSYQWFCNGQDGGATSGLCWWSPPPVVPGACSNSATPAGGSGNYSVNGCSAGTLGRNSFQSTPYAVYYWYCNGSDGTEGPLCWYTPPAPVTGVCAADSPPAGGSGSYPINGCSSGTLGSNAPQANGNYHWFCDGANGGAGSPLCWYAPPATVINGSCSATHYSCVAGSSTNNVQNSSSYTWSCAGLNGGSTASCSEAITNTSCPATMISDCSLPGTASGGSSGSCVPGDSGSCSYSCNNGTWSQNSNGCTPPSGSAPTASISAVPTTVANGSGTQLTWSSTNAQYCERSTVTAATLGQYVSGQIPTSGTGMTSPIQVSPTPFNLRCLGLDGVTYAYATVNVTIAPPSVPTATLSASPTSVASGGLSTLTWSSTNATSCTSAGGFNTGGTTSGSAPVNPLTTSTYSVTCTGPGGTSAPATAIVTVTVPTLSITAAPSRVLMGGSTTITWNAINVNSCTITRNGASWKSLTANVSKVVSGSSPDTITGQTTYVLSCKDVNGVAMATTASTIVNVAATFQEF